MEGCSLWTCRVWQMDVAKMRTTTKMASLLALASLLHVARGFYLPGVAPQDYVQGDELNIKVNKLSSVRTQLPYEYYSLPYCKPKKIIDSAENLGELLRGDRIENSVYQGRLRI
eukprot:jgi/Pico_ML_1/55173/g905.t2